MTDYYASLGLIRKPVAYLIPVAKTGKTESFLRVTDFLEALKVARDYKVKVVFKTFTNTIADHEYRSPDEQVAALTDLNVAEVF